MRITIALCGLLLLCIAAPAQASTNAPDEAVLGQIKNGMTKEQIETVLGVAGRPRENPPLLHPMYDFDFEGLFVAVTFDWSAEDKKALASEIKVVRDGRTIEQRNEERRKAFARWVDARQRRTNTVPNKVPQGIGATTPDRQH